MGALVDEQCSHCHGGFQAQRLPVGVGNGEGDSVVGDGVVSLPPQHGTFLDTLHEHLRNRYLALGLFGERHADGIADAFGEQGSYPHCTLYASVFALASLGDSQVERIVHILGVHASDEEAHRLHHNDGVRRLDGYHHVVEIVFTEDAQKLHTALHYALWGIAIAIAYAVGQ